jgi:hypothetical protein
VWPIACCTGSALELLEALSLARQFLVPNLLD